jgi:acyl-CoA thioesterase FadM
MKPLHVEKFRIGFQDTDTTARVYFPTYVKWFDIAFIEYLRKNNIVFDGAGALRVDGKPTQHTLVVGEYGCRIASPSSYDDVVEACLTAVHARRRSLRAEFALNDSGDGRLLATGWIGYVYVDMKAWKSAELPAEFLSKLGVRGESSPQT